MTPTIEQITGMESAYNHAKSLKPYSNMGISAGLVIDMRDTILAQHEEIESLKALMSKLSNAWNCGDNVDVLMAVSAIENYVQEQSK